MKLNLSREYDKGKAIAYFKKLLDKQAKIELKEYRPQRSLNQNAYLHVCFTIIANETGYTVEEAKTECKRTFGSFFIYEKRGSKFLRSSADLDTKEMTEFIDWLRQFSMDQFNAFIPSPEDYLINAFEIEKELQHTK